MRGDGKPPAPAPGVDAEKSLLGAILVGGREVLASVDGISSDHFGLEAHRVIWNAIALAEADGLGIDATTVLSVLRAGMKTEKAGGEGYVSGLLDRVPDVENAQGYARIVREGAAWRRLRTWAAPPAVGIRAPGSVLDALSEEEKTLRARLEACRTDLAEISGAKREEPGLWLDFDEMLRRRATVGERMPLGFPQLDAKLEGGVFPGTVLTVQGKPGVGKTMLAIQWARNLGRTAAVAALFADEGLAGASIAIGQQVGADREPLVKNDPAAIALALANLKSESAFFRALDPQHSEATLERLAADFDAMAPPLLPRVWLVDSAQTVRIAGPLTSKESPWERIARVVLVLRELAIRYRAVAILVSHVSRSSYKEKAEDKQSDPLGSAAGSAVIERASELIAHLEGNPTVDKPRVILRIIKNRISAGGNFLIPLAMNYARKSFLEVDAVREAAEVQAVDDAARLLAVENAVKKILDVLAGRDGVSGAQLRKEVKGRADVFFEARLALQAASKIHTRRRAARGGGEEWFIGPAPAVKPEPGQIDLVEMTEERRARGW